MKAIDILRKVDQAAAEEARKDEVIYEAVPVFTESDAEKKEIRLALGLIGLAAFGCALWFLFDGLIGGIGGGLLLLSAFSYGQSRILAA